MLLYLIVVAAPVFGILLCAWRIADYRRWWRRAEATTVTTDYSEAERAADREPFAWLRPHPMDGRSGGRPTRCEIEYVDARGRRHRAAIKRYVRRGKEPPRTMPILYDSRDPDRATYTGAVGPAVGLLILAMILFQSVRALSAGPPPLP